MKKLIIILFILIFSGCIRYNCLDKADSLCKVNPSALIKYGYMADGTPHCEAIWVKDGIEYPVDGKDSIVKFVPQNQFLKYYTWQEAQRKWR